MKDADIMDVVNDMVKVIHTAPLMISFKADLFYKALEDPDGDYLNVFERIERGTDHRKDPKYNIMRSGVENAMFGYDKGLGLIDSCQPWVGQGGQRNTTPRFVCYESVWGQDLQQEEDGSVRIQSTFRAAHPPSLRNGQLREACLWAQELENVVP
jgi:hypothetical protein